MGNKAYDILQKLTGQILDEETEIMLCENDNEFYFAVGQLAKYIISNSEANKLTYDMILPIMQAKSDTVIKKVLAKLLMRYSHAIVTLRGEKKTRFEKLNTMVQGYQCSSKEINYDMLLSGFGSPSIIYIKNIKDNQNDNQIEGSNQIEGRINREDDNQIEESNQIEGRINRRICRENE